MNSPQRIPVSCYLRTFNESPRIHRVIKTVTQLVDEVIIVDSGSTDDTTFLASQAGARVISQPWLGWGKQKRRGEEACRNDWVLDIDADEVLSDELINEIRELFKDGPPEQDAFRLPLTTVDPTGKIWRNSGVSMRAKLYDKRSLQMPDHITWDQLKLTSRMRVKDLTQPLYHHSFSDAGFLTVKQESASNLLVSGKSKRSRWTLLARIFFGFPLYFIKHYFLKGHWKVGTYGFIFSFVCAVGRWGRDVKLYERDWLTPKAESSYPNALQTSNASPTSKAA